MHIGFVIDNNEGSNVHRPEGVARPTTGRGI